jgi:hypothetical protein
MTWENNSRSEQSNCLKRIVWPHREQITDGQNGQIKPPALRIGTTDPLHVGEQTGVTSQKESGGPNVEQPTGGWPTVAAIGQTR